MIAEIEGKKFTGSWNAFLSGAEKKKARPCLPFAGAGIALPF